MPLLVPKHVDARLQTEATVRAQVDAYRGIFDHYNKLLKDIDPYCQLVKAEDNATHPALRPGFWHVIRQAPDSPPSVHIHDGPDGEYRDPDSGLLEDLRQADLWNDRARRDREKRQRAFKAAAEREREREREERVDELTDRILTSRRTSILVPS